MHAVVWWAATAVLLFILELLTASYFFIWIAAGAFFTAVVAFFTDQQWIQYTAFVASSMLLVAVSRPWANRHSKAVQRPSNVDALAGQTGYVTKVDAAIPSRGYVKIEGDSWMAESEGGEALAVNQKVQVVSVRGNAVRVRVEDSRKGV